MTHPPTAATPPLPTPEAHEALFCILADVEFLAAQRSYHCAARRFEEFRTRELQQLEREVNWLSKLGAQDSSTAVLTALRNAIFLLLRSTFDDLARRECGEAFQQHVRALRRAVNLHGATERTRLTPHELKERACTPPTT